MNRILLCAIIASLGWPAVTLAEARQVNDFEWDGVERIVAVGDIHGDYDNYLATLKAAGLVDKRGKWNGGKTHLVQTGDIPDRGPDTLEIIEHISKLVKQAERKGGRVHSLIGNHEAMNVTGDLRYVHQGEFKAFVTRGSAQLRDRYFNLVMQNLEENDPETFAGLSPDYRSEWDLNHPLGWIEHRQSWDPMWDTEGEMWSWVRGKPVIVRVNDALFLHGGISGFFCQDSLPKVTAAVHAVMANYNPADGGIIDDELGPLWYRGLSGTPPHAEEATVDAILEYHGAQHIVVGHTPTRGVILPRYGDRVVVIDTGIAAHYGGFPAYLEISGETLMAGYPGGKIAVPGSDEGHIPYMEQVVAMHPDNPYLARRLQEMKNPVTEEAADATAPAEAGAEGEEGSENDGRGPMPICDTSL